MTAVDTPRTVVARDECTYLISGRLRVREPIQDKERLVHSAHVCGGWATPPLLPRNTVSLPAPEGPPADGDRGAGGKCIELGLAELGAVAAATSAAGMRGFGACSHLAWCVCVCAYA